MTSHECSVKVAASPSEAPVVSCGLAEPLRLPSPYISRRVHLPSRRLSLDGHSTQARPVSCALCFLAQYSRLPLLSCPGDLGGVWGALLFWVHLCRVLVQSVLCVSCFLGLRLCKERDRHGPLVRVRPPDPADSSPESLELVCVHLLSCSLCESRPFCLTGVTGRAC